MPRIPPLCALLVAACTGEIQGGFDLPPDGGAADGPPAVDAELPVADGALLPGALLGAYKLTYYYVAEESMYSGDDDTGLYDLQCNLLAMVPAAFERAVAIEGTGKLTDGRVFNYSGSCSCPTSPCYHFVDEDHPWGSGSGNRPLVPFRSVAVDRNVLVIGRKYWVKELEGVRMPGEAPLGGWVHDGCVSADDTGGGIDGEHIDFFAALRGYYLTLAGQIRRDSITLHEAGEKCP
jgi:3D (Asp-Asp-Asp) domain-containing protein